MTMKDEDWTVFAEDATSAIRTIEEVLLNIEVAAPSADDVHGLYRALHTLKGSSGILSLRSFGKVAHVCEDLVSLARDHDVPFDAEMVDLLLAALDKLRSALDFLARERRDVPYEAVEEIVSRVQDAYHERGGQGRDAPPPGCVVFGADEDVFEAAPGPVGIPLAAHGTVATEGGHAEGASASPDGLPRHAPLARTEFLRIDAAKVSALMDLAGELGLACSAVTRHDAVVRSDFEGFGTAAHKLELLVREIQNDLSALRLVPVAPLFQRMRRVVRDAARLTNKDVDLVMIGDETEVDKVTLDAIQDPLVHVLRNAVDHGLESTADRIAAGKPPKGRIRLMASNQGGEVTIEVCDDGAGLDRGKVLARAKERGLCAPHATPSDDEIVGFLFEPGFSTKQVADELSGRGVGMDVLKTTVEGLRGHVKLSSKAGSGTRVMMTLPLTLAFVDAMVVRERDRLFVLPIEKVFEVSKVDRTHVVKNTVDNQTMLFVRGSCVPVIWLHQYWNEQRDAAMELDEHLVVLVQTARGAVAVPVDELVGNQQVMLKPLRGPLSNIRAAAGCGMLRTGDVAIALDCDRLHA